MKRIFGMTKLYGDAVKVHFYVLAGYGSDGKFSYVVKNFQQMIENFSD